MDYKVSAIILSILLFFIKYASSRIVIQNAGRSQRFPTKPPQPLKLSQRQQQNNICANHAVHEFVANPEDCKLFYLCEENGEAVVASCPPTMLFNPDSKLCDLASNVRCDTTTQANAGNNGESQNNEAEAPPTTSNNEGDGAGTDGDTDAARYCATITPQQDLNRISFIGSTNSCQEYYICYYGQALLQNCSANLHWNALSGKCDLPASAGCRLSPGGNVGTQNGGELPNNGGAQNNGGIGSVNFPNSGNNNNNNNNALINCPIYGQHIFPHMERCDYFIYCVKGHAVLQQCQFYYHFDIVSKRCKWRTAAICVRDLNINFRGVSKTKLIR